MALDSAAVRVAGTGKIYFAPAGTAMPVDVTSPPAVAFVDMGYVTEEGVTMTFGRETEDLNSWQGNKVRVLTTDDPATVAFALMQSDKQTLPVAFGGGICSDLAAGLFKYTPPTKGTNTERALIVEFNDGTTDYRFMFPRVQLEGETAVTLSATTAMTFPLTFGVLDSSPTKWHIVSDDLKMDMP